MAKNADLSGDARTVEDSDTVADIIAEFTELFAFTRRHFAHYIHEAYPQLKGTAMTVLRVILRQERVRATEISQMLDLDKAVVSRQLAKLRELGLINTEPAPDDGRVSLITPTPKATEIFERIKLEWSDAYRERFRTWDLGELENFRAALHRFNHSTVGSQPECSLQHCDYRGKEESGEEKSGQEESSGDKLTD